jgi:copper(I)-binding protein
MPSDAAQEPKPDIYARIMRFAPVLLVLFCAGLLVLVGFIRPFDTPASSLQMRDPLVGADNDPTGAYMVIHNAGGPDTLTGASTPAATSVILQTVSPSDPNSDNSGTPGVLVPADHLDVPGFGDLRLQPGSDQLLLQGLTAPLIVGQTITITLQFQRAGTVTVDAEVQPYSVIADRLLPPRLKLSGAN